MCWVCNYSSREIFSHCPLNKFRCTCGLWGVFIEWWLWTLTNDILQNRSHDSGLNHILHTLGVMRSVMPISMLIAAMFFHPTHLCKGQLAQLCKCKLEAMFGYSLQHWGDHEVPWSVVSVANLHTLLHYYKFNWYTFTSFPGYMCCMSPPVEYSIYLQRALQWYCRGSLLRTLWQLANRSW